MIEIKSQQNPMTLFLISFTRLLNGTGYKEIYNEITALKERVGQLERQYVLQ